MSTETNPSTVTLFRPVGESELRAIDASGWTAFPPRLPNQDKFYPVLSQDYAEAIASDWHAKNKLPGYVVAFNVQADFVSRYPVQQIGDAKNQELWVPAAELAEFNQHIVGKITLVRSLQLQAEA